MNSIFNLQEALRKELESNKLINSVSYGNLYDIDLQKQDIYPMAHVHIENGSISAESGIANLQVSILFLDVVDESKQEDYSLFYGNDNEPFVINAMFSAATKTIAELSRGNLYKEGFQVTDEVQVEFFSERFEDKLAGVGVDFSVDIKNNLDLC